MQLSIPWSSNVSVFINEKMAIIHSLKCTVPCSFVVPRLSLAVTHCHLLSLAVTRCTTRCHSSSPVVIRCYSLSLVVPIFAACCHSLSLVVPLAVTRCHSLSLDVPLVCLFINDLVWRFRSSSSKGFYGKDVLENLVKCTGKYLCRGLFFNKVACWKPITSSSRDSGTGVFLCVLRDSKEDLFYEHLWKVAFVEQYLWLESLFVMLQVSTINEQTTVLPRKNCAIYFLSSEIPERLNKIIFWKHARKQIFVRSPRQKETKTALVNVLQVSL